VSTISENTVAESAIGDNSVNQGQYIFDFEVVGLELSATDNQSEGTTRQTDGALVYDHFRPAVRAVVEDTGVVFVSASTSVVNISSINDTATFTYGDFDSIYEFNGLILEFQDDYPGLPIGPISVNAVGEIQYIGPQNFVPGLVELSIGANDNTIKSTSRITQGALEISATDNQGPGVVRISDGKLEYPHFRPVLEVERSYVTELTFGALGGAAEADPEYNNGAISNVTGNGSDFFKREVTVNGVRIVAAGTVGGQTAVPDAWLEKVARMFELFLDKDAAGINKTAQRNVIKTLRGDAGTYHAAQGPTLQRVARGAGSDYTPNFLTDAGIASYNLSPLFDTHVANDMVWYLNSTGDGYGDGEIDAQEVIEHVFHTLHMHGLDAVSLKMYPFISADWATGPLYAAMVEAYDGGFWDPSGYGGANFKTDSDAFEVAAKEYLYLLNFSMFEYTGLWDGDSLAPEWTDTVRTSSQIQTNLPLGYALFNSYIVPVISKPSLATINSIFGDGNTPAQDNPALAGVSGYVVDVLVGGNDTAYFFASDGIDRLERYAGLPISPIGVNAIGTLQYEGVMDYQPSIGELIVSDNDAFANIAVIVDTTTLAIGVDWNDGPGVVRDSDGKLEYPYFRPSLEVDVENIPFKTLAASSVEYKFENSIAYQTLTGAGLPIGPISYSAISEEQQIAGALASFFDFTDIIPLTINAVGSLDTNRQEFEFDTTVTVEVDANDIVFAVYPRTATTNFEITAADSVGKTFVYNDTGLFAVTTATDIIGISATIEVTPLIVGATSVENRVVVVPDQTLETVISGDNTRTSTTINFGIDTVSVEIGVVEDIDVIYQPVQPENPSTTFTVTGAYANIGSTISDYVIEFDTTDSNIYNEIVSVLNDRIAFTGYDLPSNESYITFWKQGVVQHAVRHSFVNQTILNTRNYYNYATLRVQASVLNGNQAIVIDTNPRGLAIATATFDNQSYNLTSLGFEFDEIRYYNGDPANNNEMLLWSASISRDFHIGADVDVKQTILIPEQTLSLDIEAQQQHLTSYNVPDQSAALEIGETHISSVIYDYETSGNFIKGSATGIVVTLGSIDTTPLVISDADSFQILYNYLDYEHNLGTLEIGDASTVSNVFGYNDLVHNLGELEITADDATVRSYDPAVGDVELEIGDASTVSNVFGYNDLVHNLGELEITVADVLAQTLVYNHPGALEISDADTVSFIYDIVDSGSFIKGSATSIEITSGTVDTTPLIITGSDNIANTFAYADSAVFVKLSVVDEDIVYNFQDSITLELAAQDQTASTTTFVNTTALEVAAQDSIQQVFEFADTGVFRAVTAFDVDIIRNIVDNVGLEITSTDKFSQSVSRITQGALEVAVDSPHTFAINRSSTAPLEIAEDGTISVAYDYADTGVFAKLAADETAFTTNRDAIGELEIAAQEAIVQIFNTEDVAALGALVVSDQQIVFVFDTVTANLFSVLSDQSSTQNFAADPALSIDTDATNSIAYTQPQDTIETVIDSISVVNKTFAYDDTAEFGLLGASDSENIFNFEYVEFNTFGATDDVDVIYNFDSEAPALEAGDTATQSSTRQYIDEVNFVTFVAASSEILVNIDNEGVLGFGVSDDVDIVYNFQPQAFIETTAFDDITQSVSRRTTAPLKVGGTTNQYYYTKFKQIYANDTIEFKLKGDSNEIKITGAVESTGPKQIWIG